MGKNEIKYQPTDTAGNPYTMEYGKVRYVIAERVRLLVSPEHAHKRLKWYNIAVCPFCGKETVYQEEQRHDIRAVSSPRIGPPMATGVVYVWKEIETCVHAGGWRVFHEEDSGDSVFVVPFDRSGEGTLPF